MSYIRTEKIREKNRKATIRYFQEYPEAKGKISKRMRINNPMFSLKIRKKMSISSKGKIFSEKHKRSLSKAMEENQNAKGYRHTEKWKKEQSKRLMGIKRSKETRKKIARAQMGVNNSNWQNGSSFEIYPKEFNNGLKEFIRNRDNRICQKCGRTEEENGRKLSVHHIDCNKKNCKKENLITLCNSCNVKVNNNKNYWIMKFQEIKWDMI